MTKTQKETIRAQLVTKTVLSPDEHELYTLSHYAGITMDPQVFKIVLDLLKLNVPPSAIVDTLKSMCTSHQTAFLGSGEPYHNQLLYTSHGSSAPGHSLGSRSMSGESQSRNLSASSSRSLSSHHHHSHSSMDSSFVDGSYASRPNLNNVTTRQHRTFEDSRNQKKDRVNKKR